MDSSCIKMFGDERSADDAGRSSGSGGGGQRRGITIELSEEVAQELRRRNEQQQPEQQRRRSSSRIITNHQQQQSEERPATKGLEVLLPGRDVPVVPDDQDWDCLIVPAAADDDDDGEDGDDHDDDGDPGGQKEEEKAAKGRQNDEDENGDDSSSTSSSTVVSLTPPATLPVVWVDVARLTGYVPGSADERAALRRTVRAALWGEEAEENERKKDATQQGAGVDSDNPDGGALILARDFEERVTELFASGVARHGDTSETTTSNNINDNNRFIAVEYPEYLCCRHVGGNDPTTEQAAAPVVLATARVWKRLGRPHAVAAVERLLARLRECSRSLLWKHRMRRELLKLVQAERADADRREQAVQLRHWKRQRRPEQLEQLYAVRETLRERVQQAERQQAVLEEQRDGAVRRELRRRRLRQSSGTAANGGVGGGLEAFDFDSTVFAFPAEEENGGAYGGGMLSLQRDDDEDGEEYRQFLEQQHYHDENEGGAFLVVSDNDDDDDDDEDYNDSSAADSDEDDEAEEEGDTDAAHRDTGAVVNPNDGENDAAAAVANPNVDDIDDAAAIAGSSAAAPPSQANRRRRHNRLKIRQRRRQEAAREAEHRAKLEAAQAEEEAVRESCTTHHLRLAMTVTQALQGKLQQVDDLLESLQEEQWADEEEAEEQEQQQSLHQNNTEEKSPAQQQQQQVSVLDQVLAMILGACPPPEGTSLEDHLRFLEQEHQTILVEWEQRFGRLPPPLPSSTNAGETAGGSDWDTTKAETTSNIGNALADATPEEMRQSLGIEENENDNWDSDEEEEEIPQERPRTVGLRPGGRLEPRQ